MKACLSVGFKTCKMSAPLRWLLRLVADRQGLLVGLLSGLMSVLLFSGCSNGTAVPHQGVSGPLRLVEGKEEYKLGAYLEILTDPTRRLSIEEIASRQQDRQFVPSPALVPNYGFTDSAIWVRFRVVNTAASLTDWQLQLRFPRIQEVTLFQPSPDASGPQSFTIKQAGSFLPMTQWEIPHRQPTFNLVLPAGPEQTFYLRVASRTMMRLPLILWSPKALADHSQSENLGWGLFFGVMLMMFSYNVTFYFLTRKRSYLLFSATVAAYAFYLASLDGWTFELLWPDSPALNRLGVRLAGPLAVLSVLFFAIAFLGTLRHLPRIHRAIRILIPIYAAAALIPLLDTSQLFPRGLHTVLAVPAFLLVLLAGVARWRQGYQPAASFLLAWIIFLCAGIVFAMLQVGFLAANSWTEGSLIAGTHDVSGFSLVYCLGRPS